MVKRKESSERKRRPRRAPTTRLLRGGTGTTYMCVCTHTYTVFTYMYIHVVQYCTCSIYLFKTTRYRYRSCIIIVDCCARQMFNHWPQPPSHDPRNGRTKRVPPQFPTIPPSDSGVLSIDGPRMHGWWSFEYSTTVPLLCRLWATFVHPMSSD